MNDVMLEACGLRYAHEHGTDVLCELNLSVRRGTRMAILGPNGSGKTTLFLCLMGVYRPSAGKVLLDKTPLSYTRDGLRQWRQQIGLMLQDPDDQIFSASVYQDVSFGPLNLGLSEAETRTRVQEALAILGIEDLARRPSHLLSYGQRKRVALAGILAMRPRMLILDEPTSGLDSTGVRQLLQYLDHLHTQGTTILFSTHDVDFAHSWADEMAFLFDGKVASCQRSDALSNKNWPDVGLERPRMALVSQELALQDLLPKDCPWPRSAAELACAIEIIRNGNLENMLTSSAEKV
ncbi:MAG: ATP-binding cassette domain-containing protein [Planctomycetota bacterium]